MSNEPGFSKTTANGQGIGTARGASGSQSNAGLSGEVHSFLDDVEDLIKEASALSGDDLARAKTNISQRLNSAREAVEAFGGEMASRARSTVDATDSYVHRQPWQAIGIGTAFGVLLGMVLARRH